MPSVGFMNSLDTPCFFSKVTRIPGRGGDRRATGQRLHDRTRVGCLGRQQRPLLAHLCPHTSPRRAGKSQEFHEKSSRHCASALPETLPIDSVVKKHLLMAVDQGEQVDG